jgi:hypothetical protein
MKNGKNICRGPAAHRGMAAVSVTALLALLLVAGCKEQGPVELLGPEQGGPIGVVAPPPQPMPGLEFGDADSAGIVPLPPEKVSGHIMIAGARYDGPLGTVEATLSRAILFDLTSSVQLQGGRTAYRTLDMGSVDIDGTPLFKVDKKVRRMGADTLLGVQYIRYNQRAGGFQYTGGMPYVWTGTGSGSVPAFTTGITGPQKIVVTVPTPETPVSATGDLAVRWSGGGATVHLVISNAGDERIDSRPILHLRLGKNGGGVVIPARILRLLPATRDRFVFTFFSESSKVAAIDGFPDDVLVQALTSHSILVRMTR